MTPRKLRARIRTSKNVWLRSIILSLTDEELKTLIKAITPEPFIK